jgi:hypothetical protein
MEKETIMSQKWQDRQLGGKHGKRDRNVAIPTLSGNMIFFF